MEKQKNAEKEKRKPEANTPQPRQGHHTQLSNVVPNPDPLVERLMTSEGKKSNSGSLKPVFPNQRWMRGNLEQLHVTIGGSSDHSEERSLNIHQTQPLSSVACPAKSPSSALSCLLISPPCRLRTQVQGDHNPCSRSSFQSSEAWIGLREMTLKALSEDTRFEIIQL